MYSLNLANTLLNEFVVSDLSDFRFPPHVNCDQRRPQLQQRTLNLPDVEMETRQVSLVNPILPFWMTQRDYHYEWFTLDKGGHPVSGLQRYLHVAV